MLLWNIFWINLTYQVIVPPIVKPILYRVLVFYFLGIDFEEQAVAPYIVKSTKLKSRSV